MTPQQISTLINLGFIALIIVIIIIIWFLIWTAIFIPIRKKDDFIKARDAAQIELLEIQSAKAVEWDKYKELESDNDRLRKAYFQTKDEKEKLQEDIAKLQVDKTNLINFNKELKKSKEESSSKEAPEQQK